MTLYQIDNTYKELLFSIEIGDIPEEAINDTLNAVEGEIDVKIDNTACFIKNLNAEVDALKNEIANLTERKRAKEKTVERLKNNIFNSMQMRNLNKLETTRNLLTVRNNRASVQIENEDNLIKWAKKHSKKYPNILTEQKPKISKTELGKLIDGEVVIEGVSKVQSQSLTIK